MSLFILSHAALDLMFQFISSNIKLLTLGVALIEMVCFWLILDFLLQAGCGADESLHYWSGV